MLSTRSDAENPFILDMAFDSNLNKEDEGAISLRKNIKLFGHLGTSCMALSYLSSSYYQEYENNRWETSLIAAGTTATYGIASVWIFLLLEKELLSEKYPEQNISRETNLFKVGKHISTSILASVCGLFAAFYSGPFTVSIGNGMFSGAASLYSFYFLFGLSNNIQALFSKKILKSVAIMRDFSLIIDDAIPVLLKMKTEERKIKISEIYSSQDKKILSLIAILQQLKQVEPGKTNTSENYKKWKKTLPSASTVFSIVFNIANIVAACAYYEKKRCYDYYARFDNDDRSHDDLHDDRIFHDDVNYSEYSNCDGINTRPEVMTAITVWMPVSFILTALTAYKIFNRLLDFVYKKEALRVVSHFYPKASYFILLLAYICSGPLLMPFFTNKTAYPLDFSYIGKGNLWYLPYQLFFTATFYLIFVPVVFDIVFQLLISNYLEMYGNEEQKDTVRLINFLNHIKENILQKAKPELVNEFFDTTEGREILTSLEVKSKQVPERRNIEEPTSGSSLGTKESFFYEDPRATLLKNSGKKSWCSIM